MARPRKQTVDYFPHQCNHKKTMFILEQRYGNDGYAFWFKLLETLGNNEGHFIDLRNEVDWQFLASLTRMEEDACEEILSLLAKLGAIDQELWAEKIVWSQKFVDGITDAYRNRKVDIPKRPDYLLNKSASNGVSYVRKPQKRKDETKEENPLSEKFSDESIEYKLADYLRKYMLKNNPKVRLPKTLENWCKEIDKMIRIDGRDPGEIKAVIEFCQKDPFWKANVLSAGKLREQYDKLYLKMMNNQGPPNDEPKKVAIK